ncbi:MAG: GtrA family protein [Solirubrobacteraceae bacterium]
MIRTTAERRRTLVGAHRLREGLRFGVVGASSTIRYFAAYSAGVLLAVPFALAAVVAFLASAAFGYMLHHRWTFRTNAASTTGLAQWVTLQGTVLLLNILALWALVFGAA